MQPSPVFQKHSDVVTVELPVALRVGKFAYGIFLMAMLAFALFSGIVPSPLKSPSYKGPILTVAAIAICLHYLWMGLAKYRLSVSQSSLTVSRKLWGVGWMRTYPLSAISSLRVGCKKNFVYQPLLAFDHNGKTRIFNVLLVAEGAEGLLIPVYLRFPRLRD
jgi:hypothetical protein